MFITKARTFSKILYFWNITFVSTPDLDIKKTKFMKILIITIRKILLCLVWPHKMKPISSARLCSQNSFWNSFKIAPLNFTVNQNCQTVSKFNSCEVYCLKYDHDKKPFNSVWKALKEKMYQNIVRVLHYLLIFFPFNSLIIVSSSKKMVAWEKKKENNRRPRLES